MQAQAVSTNSEAQTVSNSSSLQCIETLLKAGLGCIAYLRGLLPYENFSDCHLSAQANYTSSTGTVGSFDSQTRPSGVTIMTLKRGFTNEGDRILDYLEKGIFEAIEKQYLRCFIFAIYLDNKDPNNIVEAYTFNFQYHKVPGTDTVVPIMTLGDQLSRMSLCQMDGDAMVDALKRGKLPTLGDVKRSLKVMIKTLITTISQMETLPKSRYGNFKLFFNENTPDDYQPPYFRAGDADSNKWFFTTHRMAEVPESMMVGKLETGWHGVSMKVVSVSSFLPSSTEDNNAPFTGVTTRSPPKLTPVEEARIRAEDVELQKNDALNRNVVWDADGDDDAQGEDAFDDGIVLARYNGGGELAMVPIGVRGDDGAILPIPEHDNQDVRIGWIQYGGHSEPTPTHVGQLQIISRDMGETQAIPETQEVNMRSPSPLPSSGRVPTLPPSDFQSSVESAISTQQVDTLILQEKLQQRDRTTTAPEISGTPNQIHVENKLASNCIRTLRTRRTNEMEDESELDCDCGTAVDDASIFCEGDCKKWRHVWCMGYHGPQDKRLPLQFICFGCRLQRSLEWDIMAEGVRLDIIRRYKDLALFRRAIKIFEVHRPTTALQFRELIGCTAALVSQLLVRLEDEGFITTGNALSDDAPKRGKKTSKGKSKKAQKELQKTKYVFLHTAKGSKAYLDYFHADPQIENRLLGLLDMKLPMPHLDEGILDKNGPEGHSPKSNVKDGVSSNTLDNDSQTQEPSQNIATQVLTSQLEASAKRKAEGDSNRTTKKLKISIGTAVDLCD